MTRGISTTGRRYEVLGRIAAATLAALVLAAATAALPARTRVAIILSGVVLACWRVDGRGLTITCGTVSIRPIRPVTATPATAGRPASRIPVSRVRAGVWFRRDRDHPEVPAGAGTVRRRAREQTRPTGRTGAAPRPGIARRTIGTTVGTLRTQQPADDPQRPLRARSTRTRGLPPPPLQFAVVIVSSPQGGWDIGLQDGTVIRVPPDELLRIQEAPLPDEPSLDRRRITRHLNDLLRLVAGHDGSVRVPTQALLPFAGPSGSRGSSGTDWEWYQALRLAGRWGLLIVVRHGLRRWVRDLTRALTGLDTPLSRVPFQLRLTDTGRLWSELRSPGPDAGGRPGPARPGPGPVIQPGREHGSSR